MKGDVLYNETALLQSIAQGDAGAFRSVFDRYWDRIFSMALAYTKSSDLADDVVQEVFVKIWRKRHTLPEVEKFDAYLFITARNEIISTLRRKVTYLPLEEHLQNTQSEDIQAPDLMLSLKESEAFIHEAIMKLPPQQQRIYRMSRQQGLSQQEIAGQLGISVATVKVHMNKALHFIRRHIAERSGKGNLLWALILLSIEK